MLHLHGALGCEVFGFWLYGFWSLVVMYGSWYAASTDKSHRKNMVGSYAFALPQIWIFFGSNYFWVLGPWVFGWFGPSNPVGSVKHIVNQLVRTYVLRFLGCGTSAALHGGCFLFLLK